MTILYKHVDGEDIPLSVGEVAEYEAQQAAYAAGAGERLKKVISDATQEMLDAFASTRNYDGILSACTYATDPNPIFAAEGQYCVELRGATWAALHQMLGEVQLGIRPMPDGFEDIAAELPIASAEWPAVPV